MNDNNVHVDRRFERLSRLISDDGVRRLQNAHVVVAGMGGVGSWACEALARSAVGYITLVDFDVVSLTTTNRQLPATHRTIGLPKVQVIAERLRQIIPHVKVREVCRQITLNSMSEIIPTEAMDGFPKPDFVIDAIDQLGNKCALITHCVRNNIKIVCSTGAGGRLDPTQVRIADISETQKDPLARMVRIYLRKKYGFAREGSFGIPAVFSIEPPRPSLTPAHPEREMGKQEVLRDMDLDAGVDEALEGVERSDLSNMRNVIMGTFVGVTSVFGMSCASVAIRTILGEMN